jgi:hypothetical protein
MSTGRMSEARLARMHEVMAGHLKRGRVPGTLGTAVVQVQLATHSG